LLQKLAQHPVLSQYFLKEPGEFFAAMDLMGRDPKEAFEKFGHRKEFMDALREFMALLGDHFNALAETQDQARKREEDAMAIRETVSIPSDLPDHEKDIIKNVMNDKEVQVNLISWFLRFIIFQGSIEGS
jgi:hypothetical protein